MSVKNYEKMSNSQINKAVAVALGCAEENREFGWSSKLDVGEECNYCNSWADAGTIIRKNRISIKNRFEGNWMAENEWGISYRAIHDNPLRAAMIVFLMMHEAKNE